MMNKENFSELYFVLKMIANNTEEFLNTTVESMSQVINKDALCIQAQNICKMLDGSHMYAACIKEACVRDAQYCVNADADDSNDEDWIDSFHHPLFLGVVTAETPIRAKQIIAAQAGVKENIIELYDM